LSLPFYVYGWYITILPILLVRLRAFYTVTTARSPVHCLCCGWLHFAHTLPYTVTTLPLLHTRYIWLPFCYIAFAFTHAVVILPVTPFIRLHLVTLFTIYLRFALLHSVGLRCWFAVGYRTPLLTTVGYTLLVHLVVTLVTHRVVAYTWFVTYICTLRLHIYWHTVSGLPGSFALLVYWFGSRCTVAAFFAVVAGYARVRTARTFTPLFGCRFRLCYRLRFLRYILVALRYAFTARFCVCTCYVWLRLVTLLTPRLPHCGCSYVYSCTRCHTVLLLRTLHVCVTHWLVYGSRVCVVTFAAVVLPSLAVVWRSVAFATYPRLLGLHTAVWTLQLHAAFTHTRTDFALCFTLITRYGLRTGCFALRLRLLRSFVTHFAHIYAHTRGAHTYTHYTFTVTYVYWFTHALLRLRSFVHVYLRCGYFPPAHYIWLFTFTLLLRCHFTDLFRITCIYRYTHVVTVYVLVCTFILLRCYVYAFRFTTFYVGCWFAYDVYAHFTFCTLHTHVWFATFWLFTHTAFYARFTFCRLNAVGYVTHPFAVRGCTPYGWTLYVTLYNIYAPHSTHAFAVTFTGCLLRSRLRYTVLVTRSAFPRCHVAVTVGFLDCYAFCRLHHVRTHVCYVGCTRLPVYCLRVYVCVIWLYGSRAVAVDLHWLVAVTFCWFPLPHTRLRYPPAVLRILRSHAVCDCTFTRCHGSLTFYATCGSTVACVYWFCYGFGPHGCVYVVAFVALRLVCSRYFRTLPRVCAPRSALLVCDRYIFALHLLRFTPVTAVWVTAPHVYTWFPHFVFCVTHIYHRAFTYGYVTRFRLPRLRTRCRFEPDLLVLGCGLLTQFAVTLVCPLVTGYGCCGYVSVATRHTYLRSSPTLWYCGCLLVLRLRSVTPHLYRFVRLPRLIYRLRLRFGYSGCGYGYIYVWRTVCITLPTRTRLPRTWLRTAFTLLGWVGFYPLQLHFALRLRLPALRLPRTHFGCLRLHRVAYALYPVTRFAHSRCYVVILPLRFPRLVRLPFWFHTVPFPVWLPHFTRCGGYGWFTHAHARARGLRLPPLRTHVVTDYRLVGLLVALPHVIAQLFYRLLLHGRHARSLLPLVYGFTFIAVVGSPTALRFTRFTFCCYALLPLFTHCTLRCCTISHGVTRLLFTHRCCCCGLRYHVPFTLVVRYTPRFIRLRLPLVSTPAALHLRCLVTPFRLVTPPTVRGCVTLALRLCVRCTLRLRLRYTHVGLTLFLRWFTHTRYTRSPRVHLRVSVTTACTRCCYVPYFTFGWLFYGLLYYVGLRSRALLPHAFTRLLVYVTFRGYVCYVVHVVPVLRITVAHFTVTVTVYGCTLRLLRLDGYRTLHCPTPFTVYTFTYIRLLLRLRLPTLRVIHVLRLHYHGLPLRTLVGCWRCYGCAIYVVDCYYIVYLLLLFIVQCLRCYCVMQYCIVRHLLLLLYVCCLALWTDGSAVCLFTCCLIMTVGPWLLQRSQLFWCYPGPVTVTHWWLLVTVVLYIPRCGLTHLLCCCAVDCLVHVTLLLPTVGLLLRTLRLLCPAHSVGWYVYTQRSLPLPTRVVTFPSLRYVCCYAVGCCSPFTLVGCGDCCLLIPDTRLLFAVLFVVCDLPLPLVVVLFIYVVWLLLIYPLRLVTFYVYFPYTQFIPRWRYPRLLLLTDVWFTTFTLHTFPTVRSHLLLRCICYLRVAFVTLLFTLHWRLRLRCVLVRCCLLWLLVAVVTGVIRCCCWLCIVVTRCYVRYPFCLLRTFAFALLLLRLFTWLPRWLSHLRCGCWLLPAFYHVCCGCCSLRLRLFDVYVLHVCYVTRLLRLLRYRFYPFAGYVRCGYVRLFTRLLFWTLGYVVRVVTRYYVSRSFVRLRLVRYIYYALRFIVTVRSPEHVAHLHFTTVSHVTPASLPRCSAFCGWFALRCVVDLYALRCLRVTHLRCLFALWFGCSFYCPFWTVPCTYGCLCCLPHTLPFARCLALVVIPTLRFGCIYVPLDFAVICYVYRYTRYHLRLDCYHLPRWLFVVALRICCHCCYPHLRCYVDFGAVHLPNRLLLRVPGVTFYLVGLPPHHVCRFGGHHLLRF